MSVPVGHVRDLLGAPSGLCLLAFTHDSRRDEILSTIKPKLNAAHREKVLTELNNIRSAGYASVENGFAYGVKGISAPIIGQLMQQCNVVITSTLIKRRADRDDSEQFAIELLKQTAADVSKDYLV